MGLDPLTVVCPLSATPASNQRRAERFGVGLPYTLDGQEGQTRDLSATGLSFESDTAYPIGTIIDLTLRYGLDGHNFPLQCQVEVIEFGLQPGNMIVNPLLDCRRDGRQAIAFGD